MNKTIENELERCKPWLVPAIDREKEVSWDWVHQGVMNGDLQLWPGYESAMVTRVILKVEYDELQWMFAGGKLNEITKEIMPVVEDWARTQNIRRASLTARPGWSKALPDYTKSKQVKLFKELSWEE